MASTWKRPESVPFPSVWSRFQGRLEINGKIPNFWIQDIPEEYFDEAADTMSKSYVHEAPLCKFSKLAQDEVSYGEIKVYWKLLVREKLGLMCFMENPDPAGKPIIVGMNLTHPCFKGEPIPEIKGKMLDKVFYTCQYVSTLKDQYSLLGIDKYLGAMGLTVLPEFRGQGIGIELLKARTPLCKAVGLPATLTIFSATSSQKLAERCGFKDISSITYEELAEKDPKFKYPGISEHSKSVRYMYKMIE